MNWFINPYGIFHSPEINGFNKLKTEINTQTRLAKAHQVVTYQPQTIILGSSRADLGFDPDNSDWEYQPVYNLGFNGAQVYEMYRYLQHTQNTTHLKSVFLCLDFFLPDNTQQTQPDFDEGRLSVNSNGTSNHFYYLHDMVNTLLSFDVIKSSINTVLKQSDATTFNIDNGLREETGKNYNYRQMFNAYEKQYLGNDFPGALGSNVMTTQKYDDNDFYYFRQMLKTMYEYYIQSTIIIPPYHARFKELIYVSGRWSQWEDWKRCLVEINEQEAALANKQPFPIWDFSSYNAITSESVPAINDTNTQMQWFWDGVHFKKELGDLILDKVFNKESANIELPENFGVSLNSANIENYLAQLRLERDEYSETHPEDIMEIQAEKDFVDNLNRAK
jgi:hypothetical protein